jgi:hypothetical protein
MTGFLPLGFRLLAWQALLDRLVPPQVLKWNLHGLWASMAGLHRRGCRRLRQSLYDEIWRSALPVTLAPWERAGVMETVMAAPTYILWSGADAMAVSAGTRG